MFLVGAAQLNQPKRDGVRGGGALTTHMMILKGSDIN